MEGVEFSHNKTDQPISSRNLQSSPMKVQVRIAQVIRRTWHLIGLGVELRAYAAEA